MKNNGAQSRESGDGMRDRAPLDGLRQFIAARFVMSPHRSKSAARNADALAHSSSFSREVVKKRGRLSVADTFGFLQSLFGQRPTDGELKGLDTSLVYREPGRIFQQSFHNWFVKSVLSLTVNKLEQSLGVWLNRASAAQTISSLEHKTYLAAQPPAQAAGRVVFLTRPAPESGAVQGSVAVSRVVGMIPRAVDAEDSDLPGTRVFQTPPLQTLQVLTGTYLINAARAFESRMKSNAESTGGVYASGPRAVAASRANAWRAHAAVRADAVGRAIEAGRAVGAGRAVEAGRFVESVRAFGVPVFSTSASPSRMFVASGQDAARVGADPAWPREASGGNARELTAPPLSARDMAEKIKEAYVVWPVVSSAADSREAPAVGGVLVGGVAGIVSRAPGTNADAATRPTASSRHVLSTRLEHSRSTRGETLESARRRRGYVGDFLRPTVALGGLVSWFAQGRGADISEDTPAPTLYRELVARTNLAATTIRAYETSTEGRREGAGGGFTFLRREEQLRPPPQSFALAQPTRPAPVEEPLVRQVPEKQFEEIVKKEVETAMKSRSPIDSLSRADYARIADRVYSTLARRLLIDKERIGLQR